jgi:acyl-CoA synthetase (NDP forming)
VPAVFSESIAVVLQGARADGRDVLLDPEGLTLLHAMGIAVPHHLFVRTSNEIDRTAIAGFPGERLVVKVVTPHTLHKRGIGGVMIVPRDPDAAIAAIDQMEQRFARQPVTGYTINEYIPHDQSLGSEILLGMRWTDDFGPVVTLAPGGADAEFLADHLAVGSGTVILSPTLHARDRLAALLSEKTMVQTITRATRVGGSRLSLEVLADLVMKFMEFASNHMPHDVLEFEVNPLVVSDRGPVAVDVLAKLGAGSRPAHSERPLEKLKHLLEPRSIAIVGVSESGNLGRLILDKVADEGFPRDRTYVVKPGTERIAGVPCCPSIGELPERVDLMVLSVPARSVPQVVEDIIETEKAESLIVVPGGIGERSGTEGFAAEVQASLRTARETSWGGPVINGGNSMGIRSEPGHYDTTFLPNYKLRSKPARSFPLALISQSGAVAGSLASRLSTLNPRFLISVGNQTDLTVADYLSYLKDDPDIEVFACYVEGFRPLDGDRWLRAAAEITASGRSVILYRSGRTAAGASASSSHTASVAGDYPITRGLAQSAGAIVADALADFFDLTRLSCFLKDKKVTGWRLGALSNAGFECVAIADNVGSFQLQRFDPETTRRLEDIFRRCRIDAIVEVHNPVDLTPIMDDETFEEAIQVVLEADNIDVGIIGCVPLTGALNTLASAAGHRENVLDERSIASRMAQLKSAIPKPWVAVVDAGSLYDPMASLLEAHEVPTFRTSDRALRVFEQYCQNMIESMGPQTTLAASPGH